MNKPLFTAKRAIAFILFLLALWYLYLQNVRYEAFLALRNRGVLVLEKDLVAPGSTLFNSRISNIVKLISLEGKELKHWEVPDPTGEGVHATMLDSNGNLLSIIQVRSISKLASNGTLLWTSTVNAHHDLLELPNKNLVSFDLNARQIEYNGEKIAAWVDVIKILSPAGETIKTYPIAHLLQPYLNKTLVEKAKQGAEKNSLVDIFHCNGLAIAAKTFSDAVRKGDILISCRDLNLLIVTDPEFKEERWSFGPGILERQHQPSFLPDGSILVFDNRPKKKRSRVVKINIQNKKIVWEYTGAEFETFFTKSMGGVQALPNNNLLITLGIPGEVLEITPDKKLVWRFRNPDYSLPIKPGIHEPWQLYRALRYAEVPGEILSR